MPIDGVAARRGPRLFGVALLVFTSSTLVVVAATSVAAARQPDVVVEAPACDLPPPAPPSLPPSAPDSAGTSVDSLVVVVSPPTVFINVDDQSRPTRLTTNTGCAPRSSDRFVVQVGDGPEVVMASAEMIDAVMALPFTGDWRTLGAWHEI
jgi:hypothetical protein